MYLWRVDRLKEDLIAGPLSQSEQFKYLIAGAILWSLGTVPLIPGTWYDVLIGGATVVVTALGTIYIYASNGGSAGSRLLEKYTALGLVVLVRFVVIVLFPAAVVFYGLDEALGITSDETDLLDIAFTVMMDAIFYYLLGRHVREVAERQPNQAL